MHFPPGSSGQVCCSALSSFIEFEPDSGSLRGGRLNCLFPTSRQHTIVVTMTNRAVDLLFIATNGNGAEGGAASVQLPSTYTSFTSSLAIVSVK